MKVFFEFIIDFWRELIFGALILACVFLYLGYQSRGSQIADLEAENSQLRSNESSIVAANTETKTELTDGSLSEEVQPAETEEADQTDPDQFKGFNFTESDGWTYVEGDGSPSYTFSNGTRTIDVTPNPASLIVASDVEWKFDINDTEDKKSIDLTDTSQIFCSLGEDNCTRGDGRLQVLVNQNLAAEENSALQFFFTDTNYLEGGDSFTVLESFLGLIEVTD